MNFKIGDKIYKPKGYKFPGIVVLELDNNLTNI